jgi:hypothetical protein
MLTYYSEPFFRTFGSINSRLSQARLGRQKETPPPEDRSYFMGLGGKKGVGPSPVKTEDRVISAEQAEVHDPAEAVGPQEENEPEASGGDVGWFWSPLSWSAAPTQEQATTAAIEDENPPIRTETTFYTTDTVGKTAQVTEPAELNQPAISAELAKKPEASEGDVGWFWTPSSAVKGTAMVLASWATTTQGHMTMVAIEDENLSPRTETTYHVDPVIDLERKVTAIKDIKAPKKSKSYHVDPVIDLERKVTAIKDIKAPKKSKSSVIYAPNANHIVTVEKSAGFLGFLDWGSSYFDEPEAFDDMNDMAYTRNDDETAISGFSGSNAGSNATSSLSQSLPDIESDNDESLFEASAGGGSEASESLEWSSSGEESSSAESASTGSEWSSAAGTEFGDERWEVVDVFDLPEINDDDVSSAASIASVRSSQALRDLIRVRSREDGIPHEEVMQEVEESVDRVEEALAVFKQHAQRLGIEERDLFRAVQESYTSGASIDDNSSP